MIRRRTKLGDTYTWRKQILILIILCSSFSSNARQGIFKALETKQDTNYVLNYSKTLTTRVYTSNKFAHFSIRDSHENHTLRYRPNDNWNLGVGFNYSVIGINIGLNLPFINNDDNVYGKTKFLDLQSHIYIPKLAVDLIGQFYKGFYLSNSNTLLNLPVEQRYIRPDIRTTSLGLSMLYIFNDRKFSYRSFFLQNEWQKKSAGSILVGGGILGVSSKGDSTLFPHNLPYESFFHNKSFDRISNWMLAVNAGYAHTFVYKSNWFFSISLTGGTGLGSSKIEESENDLKSKSFAFNFYGTTRVGMGYNSRKVFIGMSFVYYQYLTTTPVEETFYRFGTGNTRANIAYRFGSRLIRKKIKEIDPQNELFLHKVE
jgi:hypothetical protein